MKSPQSVATFVTLSIAPWIVLAASVVYGIFAVRGHFELALMIPLGVAKFYKDFGLTDQLAYAMIPITYLAALIAAALTTFCTRVPGKVVLLLLVCCIVATNFVGCSRMAKDFSGLTGNYKLTEPSRATNLAPLAVA